MKSKNKNLFFFSTQLTPTSSYQKGDGEKVKTMTKELTEAEMFRIHQNFVMGKRAKDYKYSRALLENLVIVLKKELRILMYKDAQTIKEKIWEEVNYIETIMPHYKRLKKEEKNESVLDTHREID